MAEIKDKESTPAASPPSGPSQQTRARVFRAGLDEIAEVGLTNARVERIARRAGVTRPTVYSYFPTKEDLLREALERTETRAYQLLTERGGDGTLARLMHDVTDVFFDVVEPANAGLRRETFALILREARVMDNTARGDLYGFLAERIEVAQASGDIASEMPPREFAIAMITALFGFLTIETKPPKERREAAHSMVELMVRGAGAE